MAVADARHWNEEGALGDSKRDGRSSNQQDCRRHICGRGGGGGATGGDSGPRNGAAAARGGGGKGLAGLTDAASDVGALRASLAVAEAAAGGSSP
jgi:hypothetical protein